MVPPLQNCCCCSLKAGVVIIAILGWVITLIKVFGLVAISSQYNSSRSFSSYDGYLDSNIRHDYSDNFETQDSSSSTILAAQIGYSLITLIACILMIVGVSKNNRYFLLPWIVLSFIEYTVLSLATIIGFGLTLTVAGNTQFIGIIVFLFILFLLLCVLCWYLWVAVFSYYVHLKEEPLLTNGEGYNGISNPPSFIIPTQVYA